MLASDPEEMEMTDDWRMVINALRESGFAASGYILKKFAPREYKGVLRMHDFALYVVGRLDDVGEMVLYLYAMGNELENGELLAQYVRDECEQWKGSAVPAEQCLAIVNAMNPLMTVN